MFRKPYLLDPAAAHYYYSLVRTASPRVGKLFRPVVASYEAYEF